MKGNVDHHLTVGQLCQSLLDPRIYKNFAIHLFVLIPATLVLAWLAVTLDHHFNWQPYLDWRLRAILALLFFVVGALIVVYSYSYLLIKGEGSPGSHLGAPRRLVTSGPFSVVRHPSVIGKLLGLVGLGMLIGSPAFMIFFIPSLLAYSLLTNRYLQERFCEKAFGDSYRHYRRRVPMILPRPGALAAFFRGARSECEEEVSQAEPGAIPRYELTIYLILLGTILSLSFLLVYVLTAAD